MSDLFASDLPTNGAHTAVDENAPLAERLRPHSLSEVIGQKQLLGEGQPLAVAFAQRRMHSMIFWGPPGVGKTTLARLVAHSFDAHFVALSAVLSGVKEIREVVEQAQMLRAQGRRTVMFVDEVHRFNKAVKYYINQWLIKPVVQFIVLPHCSMGVKHG